MNEMRFPRFVIGVVFCVLTVLSVSAKADDVADGEVVHCDAGKVRVCTEPDGSGGFSVMYRNGTPLYACSEASEAGVDLRCVEAEQVCGDAEKICEAMGRRNDHWRWSESGCSCDYRRSSPTIPTPPTTPPIHPPTAPTNPTPTTPPAPPPTTPGPTTTGPACPDLDCDFRCTPENLRRILDDITALEEQLNDGAGAVLDDEELRARRAEAENLREAANECRNEALADRATALVAALDPYRPEFVRVHEHLDNLDLTVEGETGCDTWCAVGIALGSVATVTTTFLLVYYLTDWEATQD